VGPTDFIDFRWIHQDLVFPQLAGIQKNSSSGTTKFEEFPAVRSTLNCTPATPQHLACAPDLPDWAAMKIGAKYRQQTTVFSGTGTFGRVLPLQDYINLTGYNQVTHPDCPSLLIGFGHATNFTINKASRFVCDPYAEIVRVSATFRLPSWELDLSAPSPPRVLPGKGTPIRVNMNKFMQVFSEMIFSNPRARLELNSSEDLNCIFPLVLYGRNSTPIAELTPNLPEALEATFAVAMAHFLNHARQRLTGSPEYVIGVVATPNTGRLRLQLSLISARILEGLLGAIILCVGLAYLLQRHMDRLLPKGPCSIGAGASLLAGSDLLSHIPRGSEWVSDEKKKKMGLFEGKLFGLGSWSVVNGSAGENREGQREEEEVGKWFGIDFEWVENPNG